MAPRMAIVRTWVHNQAVRVENRGRSNRGYRVFDGFGKTKPIASGESSDPLHTGDFQAGRVDRFADRVVAIIGDLVPPNSDPAKAKCRITNDVFKEIPAKSGNLVDRYSVHVCSGQDTVTSIANHEFREGTVCDARCNK